MSYTPKNIKSVKIKGTGQGDLGYSKDVVATFTEMSSLYLGPFISKPLFINDDYIICVCNALMSDNGELRSYKLNRGLTDSFTLIDTIVYPTKQPYDIAYALGRVFLTTYNSSAYTIYDIEINPATGLFGSVIGTFDYPTSAGVDKPSAHPSRVGYFGCKCNTGGYDGISFFQDGVPVDRTLMTNHYFNFRFFPRASAGEYLYAIGGNPGIGDAIYIYNDSHEFLLQTSDHSANHAVDIVIGAPGGGISYERYMAHFHVGFSYPRTVIQQYDHNTRTCPRFKIQNLTIDGAIFEPFTGVWTLSAREIFLVSKDVISRWGITSRTDLSLTLIGTPIYFIVPGIAYSESLSGPDINFDIQRLIIAENYLDASFIPSTTLKCYKIY